MDNSEEFSSFTPDEPQVVWDAPAPENDNPTVSPRRVPDSQEHRYPDRVRQSPHRLDL